MKKFEIQIGEKKIEFEIKNWAERASADVLVKCGETQVLATCTISDQEIKGLEFFPLTVNYEERYYAAGKILGPRYIKREGRPSDNAIVVSRAIDRAIRPLFPEGLQREVQVITTCLSWDEENDPDILGILGASLALSISEIPWEGPVGVVRVGEKDGKMILNPTYKERENSSLDVVFAGTFQKNQKNQNEVLINMVEGSCQEVSEDLILKASDLAMLEIKKLIELQEKIQKELGKEKIVLQTKRDIELEREIEEFLGEKIEKILFSFTGKQTTKEGLEKAQRLNELKKELVEKIEESHPEKGAFAKAFFEKKVKKIIHEKALQEKRVDGRKLDEIREIKCQVNPIPRTHGSGLFCRGLTKSLSILTLGGPGEQQLIEGMEIVGKKRFLHHYNFPPYSAGEVKPLRAPTRREIGHGMLVERALLPIIPDFDDFPYTIRIVSEILCSNGSTSMASACSSTLALMDAGVPIKRPVAGIAIGLIKEGKNYKLLTDIQGPEDFHGDMDFKIAGTKKGITALQMDVKIPGITKEILKEALLRGKKARLQILDLMKKTIEKPRSQLSPLAPRIYKLKIPIEKIGELIGAKGHTIKRITETTGVTIDIEPEGTVYVTAKDEDSAKKAIGIIKNITREIRVGETFLGQVKRILNIGAILDIGSGKEGLLPTPRMKKPLRIGTKALVRVASIDEQGRINLSLVRPYKKYVKRGKTR